VSVGHLLVVEDEGGLVRTMSDRLHAEGYDVTAARTGTDGLRHALSGRFDLIVLDIMLPELTGDRILLQLREAGQATPVLMLTARSLVEERVAALKGGADDYLTKPFRMDELLARIEALLRRARGMPPSPRTPHFSIGDFDFDLLREELRKGGRLVALTSTEFALLTYLVARRGHPVARDELLREVWRYQTAPSTRTVDQHIAQLRRKLADDGSSLLRIATLHGRGYLVP